MNRLFRCAVPLLLLATARAQDQATTLLACSQAASVVVRATVLFASDPSPAWHRLHFRADEVLKGTVGAEFVLLEPAGACCGRSLFAMQTGDRCLLFLQHRGPALHPLGGSRGVVADDPALVAHVRELLTAAASGNVAPVLARNLAHVEPRIASDAAHALAVLPDLALQPLHRQQVTAALLDAVQRGSTVTASLLDVAIRLQDTTMLETLVPAYLGAARTDQAALLQKGLARFYPATVLGILPRFDTMDAAAELRAADLVAALPVDESMPALRAMLAATSRPRVQLRAAEALLENGVPLADLERAVPMQVLQLAARRRDEARTFRSIKPLRR